MGEREELESLLLAICDPGAIVGFKSEDESLPHWQMRAILASDWLRARDQRVREECAKRAKDVASKYRVIHDKNYTSPSKIPSLPDLAGEIKATIRGDAK